jgi:hypothetical protein
MEKKSQIWIMWDFYPTTCFGKLGVGKFTQLKQKQHPQYEQKWLPLWKQKLQIWIMWEFYATTCFAML